ncbi:caspase-4-like [Fukomys damarensis]|uniref:caspase-4-like n=1 Tax=Fukomys damarensis TaxID=885580 RepID=UPI0014552727|nr:caspase-4-like [Fukomys damarensis]
MPPEEFQKVCRERVEKIYPIKNKNEHMCQALIICKIVLEHLSARNGYEHDITGMKKLLEGLNYTVAMRDNLTERHKSSDSTFLELMSHGILQEICETMHGDKNPNVLQYDTIFSIFNNHIFPGQRDKPKVITVKTCRGGELSDRKSHSSEGIFRGIAYVMYISEKQP